MKTVDLYLLQGAKTNKEALQRIKLDYPEYVSVSESTLSEWRALVDKLELDNNGCALGGDGPIKKKTGRKTCPEFDQALLDELVFKVTETCSTTGQVNFERYVNLMYSHDIIMAAGKRVKETTKDENGEYKFMKAGSIMKNRNISKKFIRNWIKRMKFRRRRTTTTIKKEPTVDAIHKRQEEIQNYIKDNDFPKKSLWNQ